jgi:site-specific DNA-cytosine methylase
MTAVPWLKTFRACSASQSVKSVSGICQPTTMTQVVERINRQQPDSFILEQVPRVKGKKHQRFWKSLLDKLLGCNTKACHL